MTELQAVFDRLVPLPSGERADWQDVLQRAGVRPKRRRRFALAFAAAAAAAVAAVATPIGGALAQGIADFSAWLKDHPGTRAPEGEQRAFDAENGRSWASFPKGTELRELIRTTAGGEQYLLLGFRSGTSLCLELEGPGGRRTRPACAPASTLATIDAPIVVVRGDGSFAAGKSRERTQFSFGIVADDVERVEVEATDDVHQALLGGNAYLWVERRPREGNRVLTVSAVDALDKRTILPVSRVGSYFGARYSGFPHAPHRAPGAVLDPTIGWYVRHEARGLTPAQAKLPSKPIPHLSGLRLFKPDPRSNIVVGLADGWCIWVVGSKAQCSNEQHFFEDGPLHFVYFRSGANSSDQFGGIAGAAADGVTRIVAFLADGEQQAVPLRDNMFAAIVPNKFPLFLVAYNAANEVAGSQQFPPEPYPQPAPASAGPSGAFVTLGRSSGGIVNVAGRVASSATARVELRFETGDVVGTKPVGGRYRIAIPRPRLEAGRHYIEIVELDRRGHLIRQQSMWITLS